MKTIFSGNKRFPRKLKKKIINSLGESVYKSFLKRKEVAYSFTTFNWNSRASQKAYITTVITKDGLINETISTIKNQLLITNSNTKYQIFVSNKNQYFKLLNSGIRFNDRVEILELHENKYNMLKVEAAFGGEYFRVLFITQRFLNSIDYNWIKLLGCGFDYIFLPKGGKKCFLKHPQTLHFGFLKNKIIEV